jgi:4,5-DOPA dioxygenase extradiol
MQPALFIGHGSPMNTLLDNSFTKAWRRLAQGTPRPKAIVAISAHWFIPETAVTVAAQPRTIHDFSGFPPELHQLRYPAPGDPALARRLRDMLAPVPVRLDEQWGLDHGTWSVLAQLYPQADIPVVQLSLDRTKPAAIQLDLGRRLAPLRDEGVLIFGSGNIVHNMRAYAWDRPAQPAYDWAARFESAMRRRILAGDDAALADYGALTPDAALSVPTPEHYLPLLTVLGARRAGDDVCFPVEGVDGGSISMLAVQIG